MVKRTWILVCDASRGRLLCDAGDGKLEERARYDHPDSRAHVRDLVADAQGRKPVGTAVTSRPAGVGRPGAEPDTDPKWVEAEKFARALASVLERGLYDHAYDAVVLVAPPAFLGLLRDTVTNEVDKRVEHTIDKDYAGLEPRDLRARLAARRAA
jgi:protein required for attachment to host cells